MARESNHKGGWYFVLEYVGYDNQEHREEFCVFNGACTRQRMLGIETFVIYQRNKRDTAINRVARRGPRGL